MNLQQIKSFVSIAELGSLSKASDKLRVAQPALSRQMRLLQEEVGVRLFARHRQGMRLTEEGAELLKRVAGIMQQLEQALDEVRAVSGAVRGQVALGIVPTASDLLARPLIVRVTTAFANISLRIVEGHSGHLIDWLQRREIHGAILYGPTAHLHLKTEPLLLDELVIVGPPGSGLNPESPMALDALAHWPLVLPSRPHGLRLLVESAAAHANVGIAVRVEADSFQVLKDLVAEGFGYTILPLSSIRRECAQKQLNYAPFGEPNLTRQLVAALPAEGVASRATQTVLALARQEIAQLVSSGAWPAKLLFTTYRTNSELRKPLRRDRHGGRVPPDASQLHVA